MIDIQHAAVFRETRCVFQDLSLLVPMGCQTVILGPNGSGKSTLMRVFSRELYPVHSSKTRVRLFGQESWNVWDLRARLGILSVELQEDYPRIARGVDVVLSGFFSSYDLYDHHRVSLAQRAKCDEVMRQVGVEHLIERRFGEMSIGEQRRVLLGRALVHEPQALIFDEPTSGLDVQGCFRYLDCIRRFMRCGGTVILVTHHLHEIPPEVERVVLLKEGQVVGDGTKAEMLREDRLTHLFDTPVRLLERAGWYQVFSGT